MRYTVVLVLQPQPVPVHGGVQVAVVGDIDDDLGSLLDTKRGTRGSSRCSRASDGAVAKPLGHGSNAKVNRVPVGELRDLGCRGLRRPVGSVGNDWSRTGGVSGSWCMFVRFLEGPTETQAPAGPEALVSPAVLLMVRRRRRGTRAGRVHRPGGDAVGAVEEPDPEPGDSDGEDGETEVEHRLGHEGSGEMGTAPIAYRTSGAAGTSRVRSMAVTKARVPSRNRMDAAVSAIPSEPSRSAATVSAGRSLKTRLITNSTPTSADRANAFSR